MDNQAATPPPYLTPAEGQVGNVKVYHVHTPFSFTESTNQDNPYEVQTSQTYSSVQSKPKFTSYESDMGRSPVMTTCATCQAQVMTNVTYKVGTYAWLMCLLFILCGLVVGCCLIPFFVKFFKDVHHTCPKCNRVLHVKKKTCC